MDRERLTALRDVLDLILRLPDSVRVQVAQWLALEVARPNGHDPRPPVFPAPTPRPHKVKVKTQRRGKPNKAETAERRLIAAMQDNPGLSVIALANAAGSSRSGTGERFDSSRREAWSRRILLADGK